jgi:hypothetical protein
MFNPSFELRHDLENTVMTTPIVIEIVRNGNPIGRPTPSGQGTSATPSEDRVW